MPQRHTGWNRTEDSLTTLATLDTQHHETTVLDRPSLVEMTREQFESLLRKALRRSHRED